MLKVCVIGMGHIGNTHSRVYSEYENTSLEAVCDIDPERAKSAADKFKTRYYLDAQKMLDEIKPDIVSVATGGFEYSSDHYLPTIQALRSGSHVLCEKPICNDLKKAQEMVDTAAKFNRCLGVDLNHRFTPAARQAKKWQEEGKIGELLFINMALWIGRFEKSFDTEYYHLKALNPHSVDIMRYFGGEIDKVHCFGKKAAGRDIISSASINVRFKNSAVGHLTSSYDIERGHPMERCEVAGTKGRFVVEDMWRESVLYPAGNLVKEVYTNPVFGGFTDFYDTFKDRIISFAKQIEKKVSPLDIDGSGRDGLEASRVIHAAIESLKTKMPVKVENVRE